MNDFCTDPTCDPIPHTHLSMPDPCPHITRLQYIAARLSGDPAALAALENCEACNS